MKISIIPGRSRARAWACSAGILLSLAVGAGCTRTIVEAPPPDKTEVVVEAPGPDVVWVGGYWDWSWGHYVWVDGHWDHPDHPHAVWEKSRWERSGDHFIFVKGRWH